MKQNLDHQIGFADAEVMGYESREAHLTLYIRAWNHKRIVFDFDGVIGVCDRGTGDVSDVIEETEMSAFAQDVLQRTYETAPPVHPYRLIQVLDLDDQPALEVVFETVTIRTAD